MANAADAKLAAISVLIALHPDDAARVFTFGLHLLKKRGRERAEESLRYMTRDDS